MCCAPAPPSAALECMCAVSPICAAADLCRAGRAAGNLPCVEMAPSLRGDGTVALPIARTQYFHVCPASSLGFTKPDTLKGRGLGSLENEIQSSHVQGLRSRTVSCLHPVLWACPLFLKHFLDLFLSYSL